MQGFYKVDVYFFDKMFPASGRFTTVVGFWGVALGRLTMLVRERLLYIPASSEVPKWGTRAQRNYKRLAFPALIFALK